ncbi:MAG: LysM peptidoglycan-binding domain-containing protein [Bacteroidia bacterium]|nr:LysM peptidoglycan-binding domain-containing protein [Bacteroidia bacterium]
MQSTRNWYFIVILLFAVNTVYAQEKTQYPLTSSLGLETYQLGDFVVEQHPNLLPSQNSIRAGLLYDAEKGVIVWEKNAENAYPMASITKMMVALIAVEDVYDGKHDWNSEITYSVRVRKSRRSRRYYTVNVTYTLKDILTSVLVSSNNHNSEQLAKFLGGSVSNFVIRMNRKAKELGMNSTFYSNPSGLPEKYSANDNRSSPHDLLILALETMKYEELMDITSRGYTTVQRSNRDQKLKNTNRLTIDYKGEVDGMKTGYTRNAKYCLVASSTANDKRLISIVLGAPSVTARHDITAEMKNNYFFELGLCQLGEYSVNDAYVRAVNKGIVKISEEESKYFKVVKTKVKKTYTVRRGQNLSIIADRLGVGLSTLKRWNGISGSRIYPGQRLKYYSTGYTKVYDPDGKLDNTSKIPVLAAKASTNKSTPKKAVVKKTPAKKVYHTVRKNQTLSHIAEQYGISVKDIMRWNGLSNSNIWTGQKLVVGGRSVSSSSGGSKSKSSLITHKVRSGETLSHISDRYNVYIKDIKQWNNLRSNTIKVGQKIKVYAPKASIPKSQSGGDQKVYYVVQKGDTIWDIAQMYDGVSVSDILNENNISNSKRINPGTKLRIPVK